MPSNPVDIYVGTRLKIRRTELGLSQNRIGEMTGITFQQVQKYEKGLNRIGSSRLYEFAKILRVPVSYFFEQYEVAFGSNGVLCDNRANFDERDISEREIVTLIKNFSAIKDSTVRRSIITLAKTLSKRNDEDDEENEETVNNDEKQDANNENKQ